MYEEWNSGTVAELKWEGTISDKPVAGYVTFIGMKPHLGIMGHHSKVNQHAVVMLLSNHVYITNASLFIPVQYFVHVIPLDRATSSYCTYFQFNDYNSPRHMYLQGMHTSIKIFFIKNVPPNVC